MSKDLFFISPSSLKKHFFTFLINLIKKYRRFFGFVFPTPPPPNHTTTTMSFLTNVVSAISSGLSTQPEIVQKLIQATGDEKWGPTGTQMKELAQASHSYEEFPLLMGALWERMTPVGL